MLFIPDINGWDSWSKVFSSIKAFSPLIFEIINKEKLIVSGKIENLTPGSNAVFKLDEMVIKLYAPKEAGVDTEYDYKVEVYAMEFAKTRGVPAPRIITKGEIRDKYLFRYIIMEYNASDLQIKDIITYPLDKKLIFAKEIKGIVEKLNSPISSIIKPIDLINKEEQIIRMQGLSEELIKNFAEYSSAISWENNVLVHGDITRDNILINRDLEVILLDFADCIKAPFFYELPPIIFELFMCDKELVSCFIGDMNRDEFLEFLIMGLSIHSFCGFILKDYFKRSGIDLLAVDSIEALKNTLKEQLFK